MNLPKGPETLCFDKDEFLKVRAASASRSRAVGCVSPPCPSGVHYLGVALPARALGRAEPRLGFWAGARMQWAVRCPAWQVQPGDITSVKIVHVK